MAFGAEEIIMFGIQAGVRLYGQARQAYVEKTRERELVISNSFWQRHVARRPTFSKKQRRRRQSSRATAHKSTTRNTTISKLRPLMTYKMLRQPTISVMDSKSVLKKCTIITAASFSHCPEWDDIENKKTYIAIGIGLSKYAGFLGNAKTGRYKSGARLLADDGFSIHH